MFMQLTTPQPTNICTLHTESISMTKNNRAQRNNWNCEMTARMEAKEDESEMRRIVEKQRQSTVLDATATEKPKTQTEKKKSCEEQ